MKKRLSFSLMVLMMALVSDIQHTHIDRAEENKNNISYTSQIDFISNNEVYITNGKINIDSGKITYTGKSVHYSNNENVLYTENDSWYLSNNDFSDPRKITDENTYKKSVSGAESIYGICYGILDHYLLMNIGCKTFQNAGWKGKTIKYVHSVFDLNKSDTEEYTALDLIDKSIPEIIKLMGEEFEFARLTYPKICFSNYSVFPGLNFWVELKSEDSVEIKGLIDDEWVINLNGKNAKEELKTGGYKLSDIATTGSEAYIADDINEGISYKSITDKYGKLSATVDRPPHIRGTMRAEDGFIKCVINKNGKSMELYFRNEGLVKSESDWSKTFTYDDLVDARLKLYCGVVYAKSDDWQAAYNTNPR